MTAKKVKVIVCDHPSCTAQLAARRGETFPELRRRAVRENGWWSAASTRDGGYTDICRWHS